jgi:hypothetical protein
MACTSLDGQIGTEGTRGRKPVMQSFGPLAIHRQAV